MKLKQPYTAFVITLLKMSWNILLLIVQWQSSYICLSSSLEVLTPQ